MNRMEFERIKHSAAEEVFSGTEYSYLDALDNTADADRSAMILVDEDKMKAFWLAFFRDTLSAWRYSDSQSAE